MPGSGKRRDACAPLRKAFSMRASVIACNSQPPAGADDRFIRGCRCHHAGITPAMCGCQRRRADRLAAGILPYRLVHIRRLIFQMFMLTRRSLHSRMV